MAYSFKWFSASSYEIHDLSIRPAVGAVACEKQVDPVAAGLELAELGAALQSVERDWNPPTEIADRITKWFARFGPLGLLHQRTFQFTEWPQVEAFDHGPFVVKQRTSFRSPFGWGYSEARSSVTDVRLAARLEAGPAEIHPADFNRFETIERWRPTALARSPRGLDWGPIESVPLERWVNEWNHEPLAHTRPVAALDSAEFFSRYSEPTAFFANAAEHFAQALRLLDSPRKADGERYLADLARDVEIRVEDSALRPNHGFSLISVIAWERLAALVRGKTQRCENERCTRWFDATNKNQRFCKPPPGEGSCAHRVAQRAFKEREMDPKQRMIRTKKQVARARKKRAR